MKRWFCANLIGSWWKFITEYSLVSLTASSCLCGLLLLCCTCAHLIKTYLHILLCYNALVSPCSVHVHVVHVKLYFCPQECSFMDMHRLELLCAFTQALWWARTLNKHMHACTVHSSFSAVRDYCVSPFLSLAVSPNRPPGHASLSGYF